MDLGVQTQHSITIPWLRSETSYKASANPFDNASVNFLLLPNCSGPIAQASQETLKHAAEPLGVEDDVIEIANKYNKGAYVIAASDTGSKGYMDNPDLVKQGGLLMQRLSRPPFDTFTRKVLQNIHFN